MSKIENVFYSSPDPNVKRQKSKKSEKSKISGSSTTKEMTFEEILMPKEVELNAENVEREKIEILLKQIGNQGEKLKRSKQLEDLDKYKKLVKEYISIVLALSENTEQKILWDRKKKEKVTKVHLKIIDHEMLELTRIFIQEQQNTLAIAAKIDKIEGLLVDLKS